MKNFILLLVLLCPFGLRAQDCASAQSQIDINGNALKVRLLGGGELGGNLLFPLFQPNYTGPSTPSTVFVGALWMAGLDQAKNLKLDAVNYRSGYFPGPLDHTTGTTNAATCTNWDRFFQITSDNVAAFLNDWADGTLNNDHPAIKGWPAYGNPFFANIYGFELPANNPYLAPFHDEDGDGAYNPEKGDYPVVKLQGYPAFVPTVQIWDVFNDNGGSGNIPAEVQLTTFQFSCPTNPVLNNTMFTSYKVINAGNEAVDSFSLGLFVDFDLGCYLDDYQGSNPATNTFYAYNAGNTDNPDCSGNYTFGENPPVQAVTFLNTSLDRFVPIYGTSPGSPAPGTTDPVNPAEYFHYINGHWRDDTPLTYGGSGYAPGIPNQIPAKLAFSSNPNDPNGWSMVASNLTAKDQRGLGMHYLGTFHPGAITELTAAWSYHRVPGQNYLQNVGSMLSDVQNIKNLYGNNFDNVCAPFVAAYEPSQGQNGIQLQPNPTRDAVQVVFETAQSGILRVLGINGTCIYASKVVDRTNVSLETQNWESGIYIVQFVSGDKVRTQKLVVEK